MPLVLLVYVLKLVQVMMIVVMMASYVVATDVVALACLEILQLLFVLLYYDRSILPL